MKVTVAFEDGVILVDGVPKTEFDFSGVDQNWHALQWLGDKGWIEVRVGDRIWLDTDVLVQPFVDMYDAKIIPPDPVDPVPAYITRRQCALQLLAIQFISAQEALDMTKDGTPPAAVQTSLNALQEPEKTLAYIDFAATEYHRNNPLLASLLEANNMTEQQIDDFFISAGTL